jgi:diguanylate cyclase
VVLDGLHVQPTPASVSPSAPSMAAIWERYCATPTSPCIGPNTPRPATWSTPQTETDTSPRRNRTPRQLRHAIEHGDLAVHYQPKVSLCSGEMIGVEALVRWHHPDLGLLYPDQFLPLARHNALMQAMTEPVVQRALDDAAVRHARGHRIPLAVNLFPPTLADLDYPIRLGHALEGHGLTSSALAVEITEEFMLGNLDRARIVLTGLHCLGFRIAIDDFGSGYSSLYYLHELPIDEVKLDRSFIASITEDPRAAAIVRSVIDLSHTLGLTTVAEGVENPGTAALLTGYGCDIAQGPPPSSPTSSARSGRRWARVSASRRRSAGRSATRTSPR